MAQSQGVTEFMNNKMLFVMNITITEVKPHTWLINTSLVFSIVSEIFSSFCKKIQVLDYKLKHDYVSITEVSNNGA